MQKGAKYWSRFHYSLDPHSLAFPDPDKVAAAADKQTVPRSFTFMTKGISEDYPIRNHIYSPNMTLSPSFHISVTRVSPG